MYLMLACNPIIDTLVTHYMKKLPDLKRNNNNNKLHKRKENVIPKNKKHMYVYLIIIKL